MVRRAVFSMALDSKEEKEEEEHYGDAGSKGVHEELQYAGWCA